MPGQSTYIYYLDISINKNGIKESSVYLHKPKSYTVLPFYIYKLLRLSPVAPIETYRAI